MVLGIPDPAIWVAYLLLVVLAGLCVVYGVLNWNKGGDVSARVMDEEKKWLKEEIEVDEELSDGGTK